MKWMMALAALLLLQALAPAAAPPAAKWPADGGAAVLPVAGGTTVLPADGVLPAEGGMAGDAFEQAVEGWVAELAKQPGFEAWAGAEWKRQPLGPGMHGWVVTLTANGREVGYLIVSADPGGGLVLTEYGHGEFPLFSERTLHQALVRHGLIDSSVSRQQLASDPAITRQRIYGDAFHALWRVGQNGDTSYFDAKTGERLPLDPGKLREAEADGAAASAGTDGAAASARTDGTAANVIADSVAASAGADSTAQGDRPQRLQKTAALGGFDPYYDLGWMAAEPLAMREPEQLAASLDERNRWICVVELYGGAAAFAFAVTGYHRWDNGDIYLALEQEGPRFIPADAVLRQGGFHPAGTAGEPIWRD